MTWFERAVRDLTPPGTDPGAATDVADAFTGAFTDTFTDTFTDAPADAFETPDPTTVSWGLDALDALGIDTVEAVVSVAYLTGDADLDGHDSPSAVFESILLDLELPDPETLGISLGVDGFSPVDATGFVGDEGGFTDAVTSWMTGSAEAETTSVDPATRGDEEPLVPDTGAFDDPGLDRGPDSDPDVEFDGPPDELDTAFTDTAFTDTAFTDDGEMPADDVWDDLQP